MEGKRDSRIEEKMKISFDLPISQIALVVNNGLEAVSGKGERLVLLLREREGN